MTAKAWPERRKRAAGEVAATLYGVVMIMAAMLAVSPEELSPAVGVFGALGVGLAIFATRCFTETVKAETESGGDLAAGAMARIVKAQAPVMTFPLVIAAVIAAAFALGVDAARIIDLVFYLGAIGVFLIGFSSSYLLNGRLGFALRRGGYWLLLSAILLAIKKLG